MKTVANLITSIIIALWVIAIAIMSVQNYTLVSLKFITLQSIQIPFGIILAFGVGIGMVGMTVIQPLWNIGSSKQGNDILEDAEFFVDEEDL